MKNFRPSNRGFTLIEMLMVVAMVAILTAIALPAYNGYVNRSKIKTVQADLVALSLNFENRYQRQLSYPPPSGTGSVDLSDTTKVKNYFTGWAPATEEFEFKSDSTYSTSARYKILATGKTGTGVSGCVVSITNGGDRQITSCSYSGDGKWL